MKKQLAKMIPIAVLCFTMMGCQNIASSKLRDTKADDLKLSVWVSETNGDPKSSVNAILKTIPEDVGIQFNEGETLSVTTENANGDVLPNVNMAYDSNFLNLGEQYVARIDKPETGRDYQITYKDREDVSVTAVFSSEGVPDLTFPTEGLVIQLRQTVHLTWETQNLGQLYVRVVYPISGGTGYSSFNTTDTGQYDLDFNRSLLTDAVPGQTTISLNHDTIYRSMPGFGEANVVVTSSSTRQVHLQSQAALRGLTTDVDKSKLTDEEILEECGVVCQEGESKQVDFGNGLVDCCL